MAAATNIPATTLSGSSPHLKHAKDTTDKDDQKRMK